MNVQPIGQIGLAFAICLSNGMPTASASERRSADVVLSYRAPQEVTLGEPVVIEFIATNHLTENVRMDLGWNRVERLTFHVTGPDGGTQRVNPSESGAGGIALLPSLTVKAGRTYLQRIILNEWVAFSTTGTYRVRVEYSGAVATLDGTARAVLRRQVLEVEVLPRNPDALRRLCELLLPIALEGGERGLEAGRTLTHVQDSVAVPYMRELIEKEHSRSDAVRNLERIGTKEAEEALSALSRSEDADTASLAHAALLRLVTNKK